jgi:hypothetical protein
MGHYRTGSSVVQVHTSSGPQTPVLVYNASFDRIEWSVTGIVPHYCDIQQSADGVTGWTSFATVLWADGSNSPDDFFFYQVVGQDPMHLPLTNPSNVVFAG